MVSKHQSTGMTGLYLVAAELSTRGLIVSPTSRSAQAADLLVTDPTCKHAYAVQVKTNARTFNFWLVNAKALELVSENFIYGLVNLTKNGPEFFLVPSEVAAKKIKTSKPTTTRNEVWYSIDRKDVIEYKDRWSIFKNESNPNAEPAHILRPE
jgi:hypothetical protein